MLRFGAYLASDDAQCNTPCGGNSAQKCGGGDRLSVYSSQKMLKIIKKPAPTEQVGNWTYQGCATSNGGQWNKPLPWKLSNETGNTPEWSVRLNVCSIIQLTVQVPRQMRKVWVYGRWNGVRR